MYHGKMLKGKSASKVNTITLIEIKGYRRTFKKKIRKIT